MPKNRTGRVDTLNAVTSPDLHPRSHGWTDWDRDELLAGKQDRGISVSLVLPARNEAATVGDIVARVRAELVEEVPIVDEIVVIDSDSSDATAAVAGDAGAAVHAAGTVRPDLGHGQGKGEAIWKSLFVTDSDVLVFMDADLTEWDTHFVTGLLGPLLTSDDVHLVKGFYDRPLAADAGDEEAASEGGRVTELVARPLLNLHWPELAGIVQPLAGEWAARRTLLESLTVPTGYAVDLAALVDAFEMLGGDAIAQVDLGRRKHGHQPIRDLGAMALQIIAFAEARCSGHPADEEVALRQFDWSSGTAVPVKRVVDLGQRPPAGSVAGYAGRTTIAVGGAAPC